MAGGPVYPMSTFPVTADVVFANVHEGDGANSKQDIGLGVEASVNPDGIWRLRFPMPVVIPSGSPKLRIIMLADAVTGAAKINPKWTSVAMGVDPSSATLTAEGTFTFTWSTNDDDEYQELVIDLDGTTAPAAEEIVIMDLTFETTSWTLAQILTCYPSIFWE